jgi:lysophospholipase L1-like esterase
MKQILLLGDSIRMGYCGNVKQLLAKDAEVIYPCENCRSSQNIIMSLTAWVKLCKPQSVKVVQFNCGHWDAAHFQYDAEPLTSEREYRKNLAVIVRMLKGRFPQATLVFATTTPMNPAYPENSNPRTTEDIMRYNEIAAEVMRENGVEINDLFSLMNECGEDSYIDYCHLTEQEYERLGRQVAKCLKRYL